jgi:hypothetical protein
MTDQVEHSADKVIEPEAGPGGTPSVTVSVKATISGEWVTPEIIGSTVRQLADTLTARLREEGGIR